MDLLTNEKSSKLVLVTNEGKKYVSAYEPEMQSVFRVSLDNNANVIEEFVMTHFEEFNGSHDCFNSCTIHGQDREKLKDLIISIV